MTFRPRTAAPLGAAFAVVLAVSGCHAGSSGSSGASQQSRAASTPTDQATAVAGNGTTPAAAGGNKHACSVVTEQEASTALGADPGPGHETAPGVTGVGDCEYGGVIGAGVRVTVDSSGVGKAIYDGDRSTVTTNNPASLVDVPGVGDGAFETPSGASEATVYFYRGGTFVEIALETDSSGPPKDQVIALATTAAGRV